MMGACSGKARFLGRAGAAVGLALLCAVFAACLAAPRAFAAFDYDGEVDTSWHDGSGSYSLTTAAQLAGLSYLVSEGDDFAGETVTLGADIDLEGRNWYPIGDWYLTNNSFNGTFDGGGHTITGLYIDRLNADNQALFAVVQDAVIENLTVYGQVTGGSTCAGIVADADASMLANLTNHADVTSVGISSDVWGEEKSYNGSAAGVVCHSFANSGESVSYANLVNYGTIRGTAPNGNGGVMGYLVGAEGATFDVSRCRNYGDVIVSAAQNVDDVDDAAGGVVGNTGDLGTYHVSNCSNAGAVSASNLGSVGGIVGSMGGAGSTIDHSSNTGSVTNLANEFEWPTDSTPSAGGVVSRFDSADGAVTNNYSTGVVSASTGNSGGIIGVTPQDPRSIASNNYYLASTSTGAFNDASTGIASDAFLSGQAASQGELEALVDEGAGGVAEIDFDDYEMVEMSPSQLDDAAEQSAAPRAEAQTAPERALAAVIVAVAFAAGLLLELRRFRVQALAGGRMA